MSAPETEVLIVDDDEPTQQLLQALMRRQKVSTVIASHGGEAINLLRERPFAAVILDLMMPAVAGHDVIEFVAAELPWLPIIVCTAAGPLQTRDLDPRVVKVIIRKPFDIDEVLDAVSGILSGIPKEPS
jgi:DNA-binding NtrC family response regulator